MEPQPQRYERIQFEVEAIRITEANIIEMSSWCRGELKIEVGFDPYIVLSVEQNGQHSRKNRANVGDWITKNGRINKVYTDKQFNATLSPVRETPVVALEEWIDWAMREQDNATYYQTGKSMLAVRDDAVKEIIKLFGKQE